MKMMMRVTGSAAALCAGVMMVGCAHGQESSQPAEAAVAAPIAVAAKPARDNKYDKPGFYTELDAKDGRLWVFEEGSKDLEDYKAKGKPARHVLRPGAGPDGLTLKATESDTIVSYIVVKPGFFTKIDPKDGRLWVFKDGSEDLAAFKEKGNPARHVLRPSAGPLGMTLKATESDTILEYVAAKHGFYVSLDKDGRLWIFAESSEALASFKDKGKPARHVVRPGAGPFGTTIKAVEFDVLDAYQAAK